MSASSVDTRTTLCMHRKTQGFTPALTLVVPQYKSSGPRGSHPPRPVNGMLEHPLVVT